MVEYYTLFLTAVTVLFVLSAGALLIMSLLQALRRRGQRAAVYFGLTLLASIVAAGFYFFRRLLG